MKIKTLLIAAAMLLCFSAVASAQVIWSTSSTPVTTVISSGNAELTGTITFTPTNGAAAMAGTIQIQYGTGVNITSRFSDIVIGSPGSAVTVNQSASTYSPGLLVLNIPDLLPASAPITLSNVRVQINGTNLSNLSALISTTNNLIQAGGQTLTVINSIAPGIASVSSFDGGAPVLKAATAAATTISAVTGTINAGSGTTTVAIKEGFLNAFSKNVGVRLTISAIPVKGISFGFPTTATSYNTLSASAATSTSLAAVNTGWAIGDSAGLNSTANVTISSTSTNAGDLSVYYYVGTDAPTGPTNVEYLEIPITITSSSPTTPVASVLFTVTVTLAPLGDPYKSGVPPNSLPRFAQADAGTVNVASITGSNSVLLMPYAYASKTPGDWNTALAISNTTKDPGTAVLGFTGAVAQAGSLTFYFFPVDTTLGSFKYATAAGSPGSGLTAGALPAGGTYVVFLDQIFPLAVPTDSTSTKVLGNSFSGYIIVVTNFTNAHGTYVLSNFTTLTQQSGLMLVMNSNRVVSDSLNN